MPHGIRPTAVLFTLFASTLLANVPPTMAQPASPAPAMRPPPAMSPGAATPPAPPANPPEDTLVTARVRHEFDAWQSGRIDRATYSPNAGGTYIDAFVAVVSPDLAAVGPLQSVQYQTSSQVLGDTVYRYDVSGTSGVVSVLYLLDARGKTDLIVFTPRIFRSVPPSP